MAQFRNDHALELSQAAAIRHSSIVLPDGDPDPLGFDIGTVYYLMHARDADGLRVVDFSDSEYQAIRTMWELRNLLAHRRVASEQLLDRFCAAIAR